MSVLRKEVAYRKLTPTISNLCTLFNASSFLKHTNKRVQLFLKASQMNYMKWAALHKN